MHADFVRMNNTESEYLEFVARIKLLDWLEIINYAYCN